MGFNNLKVVMGYFYYGILIIMFLGISMNSWSVGRFCYNVDNLVKSSEGEITLAGSEI